jgi:methyl-accepting chemotaxis protein
MASPLQELAESRDISLHRKKDKYNNDFIDLKVIDSGLETITQDINYKAIVHDGLGKSYLEPLGMGANFWSFAVIFSSEDEISEFKTFYEKQKPFILVSPFYPELKIPLNFASISELKYDADKKNCSVNITITDAIYEEENLYEETIANIIDLYKKESKKKSILDKMRDIAKRVSDFSSNVNEKVSSYTNAINEYATAFNQICQGIASSSTIVTGPINSVKDSLGLVVGGFGGIINGLFEAKNAITNIPGDINNIIDKVSSLSDQFKNLFKSGEDYSQDITYNTQFLQELAEATIDINFNEGVYGDSENSNGIRNNNDALQFLLLNGIMSGIYENLELIDSWTLIDLDSIKATENKLYNKLISYNFLTNDYTNDLDLLRANFYSVFNQLYKNGNKIIEYNTNNMPISIYNIIYSVNGNLDFLEETIRLNNIVKPFVSGKIKVITNG